MSVALVTGAAGGIGSEIARALVESEKAVALVDRGIPALWDLAEKLDAAGGRVLAVAADVAVPEEVAAAVARTEAVLGPVDALVNAAGILQHGRIEEMAELDWATTLAVNAGGVFHVCQAVARRMQSRRRGAIVTVSSNAATTPRIGMSAYAASKAAASMLTRCLGLELAEYGIRCNVVAPGSTATPMLTALFDGSDAERATIDGVPQDFRIGIPLGRIARPSDIADAVLFLLSDEARHITMQQLTVDGGATLGA
ncbi:2,3-dihydro-2,3-dihydroxybenzoate dehydrogenase [Nocardia sp. NPDC005998]|uniref:2,3-dihydro-2,3-dihydroxybenzoate dehydrogenase n=1 Tax=Nocardia sp. NPDC005998 TaxID=3156894 RepID=UPI0033ACAC9B